MSERKKRNKWLRSKLKSLSSMTGKGIHKSIRTVGEKLGSPMRKHNKALIKDAYESSRKSAEEKKRTREESKKREEEREAKRFRRILRRR